MSQLIRFTFPFFYFQATRLNRWPLVGYNALVEWIPAVFISLAYSQFDPSVLAIVALSYVAFISLYEIGYLVNDSLSERFEKRPSQRLGGQHLSVPQLAWLIGVRLFVFGLASYFLGATNNLVWWAFHSGLIITFVLHNLLPKENRIATFFSLSTFRYFGPIILSLNAQVLTVLLPTILLNNSLYRVTVYIRNQTTGDQESVGAKFAFYLGCFPLSGVLAIFFESWLPIVLCGYYFAVWSLYLLLSKLKPSVV